MTQTEFPCAGCGAALEYKPGTTVMECPYCGENNAIPQSEEDIEEIDFRSVLQEQADSGVTEESTKVKCSNCAAEFSWDANIQAEDCPFCGTPIVRENARKSAHLKPQALLPFALDAKQARGKFRDWLQGLWFAPNKVKKFARDEGGLTGMYVPYWTYDCATTSYYTGQRGTYYYVTETYTANEDGRPVQRTRQVRKTRWYPVNGKVSRKFDDVLILASRSLPERYAKALEPWDLESLEPYNEQYLSGFRAESYTVDLPSGFEQAKKIMDGVIRGDVRNDIGGDEQRIGSVKTRHDNITFKHVLLPVYLAAYRFGDRSYRFLVNARTGEVQGERPYSWIKIALAVLTVAVAIGLLAIGLNDAVCRGGSWCGS